MSEIQALYFCIKRRVGIFKSHANTAARYTMKLMYVTRSLSKRKRQTILLDSEIVPNGKRNENISKSEIIIFVRYASENCMEQNGNTITRAYKFIMLCRLTQMKI